MKNTENHLNFVDCTWNDWFEETIGEFVFIIYAIDISYSAPKSSLPYPIQAILELDSFPWIAALCIFVRIIFIPGTAATYGPL